jgi:hypothetical protein
VAVLFMAVLHFLDGDEPGRIVAQVRDRLVPGSYLVVSHVADLPDTVEAPERAAATQAAAELYADLAAPFVLRTPGQIGALFAGFGLAEPGLVPAHLWRPDRDRAGPRVPVLVGVGRLADRDAAVDSRPDPGLAPRRGPGGTGTLRTGTAAPDAPGGGLDANGVGVDRD